MTSKRGTTATKLPQEDRLYAEMLSALIDLDDELASKSPRLKRVQLLQLRAATRRLELSNLAKSLSLVPRTTIDSLYRRIRREGLKAHNVDDTAARIADANKRAKDAHPKVHIRNVEAILKASGRRAADAVARVTSDFLTRSRQDTERARRIFSLLEASAVKKHKAAMKRAFSKSRRKK